IFLKTDGQEQNASAGNEQNASPNTPPYQQPIVSAPRRRRDASRRRLGGCLNGSGHLGEDHAVLVHSVGTRLGRGLRWILRTRRRAGGRSHRGGDNRRRLFLDGRLLCRQDVHLQFLRQILSQVGLPQEKQSETSRDHRVSAGLAGIIPLAVRF